MSAQGLPEECGSLTVGSRFDRFLLDLTRPLLSLPEQDRMIGVFRGLTERCLKDSEAVERWNSEVAGNGAPMEFSIVIDRRADVSFRYAVDPPGRRQDVERSGHALRTWVDLVVPCHDTCSATIDELLKRFPAMMGDLRESYVAFGVRYAPGKSQAGRLYFKTGDRPAELVHAFLSAHLKEDDLRLLQRPPLSFGVLVGIGYDFHPAGLGRVKVYVLLPRLSKEMSLDMIRQVCGDRGVEIQRILDKISRHKHPFWVAPANLVSVGFRLDDNSRDIKISLAAQQWEWNSFRELWPAVSLVLNEWNIPVRSEISAPCSREPYWRFTPNWLSIDASAGTESLSVYFNPLTADHFVPPGAPVLKESPSFRTAAPEGEDRSGARIFEMMFEELVRGDARGASG